MNVLRPPLTPMFHIPTPLQSRHRRIPSTLYPIRSSTQDSESAPSDSTTTPLDDSVELRFRRGSRKRQKELEYPNNDRPRKITVPKKWEEMSFSEKALELYVGEKGALYWLNKFAYASIFIIIGAWILFRFVGPALNLYQLDSDPLPPNAIVKS